MRKLQLPYVNLPEELMTLLKGNYSLSTAAGPIFEIIRNNRALHQQLEKSFSDLDDGRGVEKVMVALGWSNFRNRVASLYLYKLLYGNFPSKTDPSMVDDLVGLEVKFLDHAVQSNSRVFLLGFYLRVAQLQIQRKENNQFLELNLPVEEILAVLKLTQGRTEKIDWLILIIMHLVDSLGVKQVTSSIMSGKSFNELYPQIDQESRKMMFDNLISYGASIQDEDIFLYEKI